jgi:hypothetical protein
MRIKADLTGRGLITLALLSVLCFAQKRTTVAGSTAPNPSVRFDIPDEGRTLQIHVGNKLNYRTISLAVSRIPSFDQNDVGEKSDPATDYRFSPLAIHDSFRNVVYFSVYNFATAGNANADRALFSYAPETGAIAGPLSTREFSVSYGMLALSPDGRYLVFSDGGHGGMCANTLGLTVLNLETKTEVDRLFLPADSVGDVDFVTWTGPNTFKYHENTWRNRQGCLKSPENPTIAEKVHAVDETGDANRKPAH